MTGISTLTADLDLPVQQETIRAKCYHPTGLFLDFQKEQIEQSIPALFEQQVAGYPDRVAVKSKTQTLTYDDLNRLSNGVARAILAQLGDGQEPVALLLEQSEAAIAAVLGVVKAGRIYIPLDPSYARTSLADHPGKFSVRHHLV